ncbi:uncharacterized protein BX663DRAFT_495963 [Cokeromyces recurvatus]|uniref:uncharacterized protein n=1 Tax=Cokeromyces recurvatus TaxID=90255 RepID=UPI002220714C|nr:uncharacterized protein BX663DRAFT_495963 [Cokeromyces recurvatus]KAI7906305.1 hypothetical protein BX663DRAFT_495963 [Cokeromyces recurvatus]
MSTDEPPAILLRWCKDRSGIRLKPNYFKAWYDASTIKSTSTTEALYNDLINDFLHKDISETSESVIEDNFGQSVVDIFPATHLRSDGVVLQIQDTIDISNSAYSLLNNLNNLVPVRHTYVERSANEEVEFSRGMLRWTLTDGTKQIQAMEMETIHELDLKTPFGCKLLIKNCQVRRGMLLLNKNNVKVLGGNVPELYGGNMINELERRLKAKLGLLVEEDNPPTKSNHLMIENRSQPTITRTIQSPDLVDEIEDFDDDDIDYSMLEAFENRMDVDKVVESIENHALAIPSDDPILDNDDFMDPPISPRRTAQEVSMQSLSPSKRMRTESEIMASQEESQELSWVDASVWDSMNELEKCQAIMEVDKDGKAHCSFEVLQKTLKSMEQPNYAGHVADTVIVKVKCIKLATLRMSTIHGFYLEVEIGDPEDKVKGTVKVVFNNEILTRLLGVKQKDVIELNKTGGKKAVAKQIFKPFETKVKSTLAKLEIDLTVLESEASKEGSDSKSLMPLVIGYEPCT